MKPKLTLIILIGSLFSISCVNQNKEEIRLKDDLINKLIHHPELERSKLDGRIIILGTKFCLDCDCKRYFQNYQNQIQIFSVEDAFMRGLKNYVEIEYINETKGELLLSQKLGHSWQSKKDNVQHLLIE